ncbi:calcitonin gene-related peptide type 1 receptor-like [Gigantopelta aegis]|uniref:calcitonin gene-related peptide type 1 receptor-like n=1 Tax=Gigantopelta aegis TaxID=1735272 RepID=UPI001B88BA86|nr:calcitonin gene-related peptide type 1 receptor-like [Gigantopelta aegis]
MEMLCRDRYGSFPLSVFKVWSCTMCYSYLFRDSMELRADMPKPQLVAINGSRYPPGTVFYPDIQNTTIARAVCNSLDDFNCGRWTSCCRRAVECCEEQNHDPPPSFEEDEYCPRTWDGFGCFKDTRRSGVAVINCPTYIEHSNPAADATKICTENATWFRDPASKQEWTDYTNCVLMQNFMTLYKVGVACNAISLILLLPSCVIFMAFRQLRVQHRIQLHTCLFASFIFTNGVMICWDSLVYKDRLEKPLEESVMHINTVGCRILYTASRYAWTCNFVWMFLEAFHLYRLIVHAFKVPKSLKLYFIGGWVSPLIPVVSYAIIRGVRKDGSCWVHHAGGFEWLIYTPNLLCIMANFFFLGSILWILLTQLQSHPNEPSSYRRALKATFILVPLFGIQLVLVIYRPPQDWTGSFGYEILVKVVSNTQGAIVALIFCFLNGEVHSNIGGVIPMTMKRGPLRADIVASNSMSTQCTTDVARTHQVRNGGGSLTDNKANYIALSTIDKDTPNGMYNRK